MRSITKLTAVAMPWAITHATVYRSGIAGSTARASAFTPTLSANVVAYSATKPANRARPPADDVKVNRRFSR